MTDDPKGPNAGGMPTFTTADLLTAERVKSMLRDIDIEAADARVSAATVTLCIRLALSRVVLFGAYLLLELSVVVSPDIEGPR